ncbi:protein MAIN-LIKE 2-like [Arachis hypogaea]|uniref:protein MAIN-LIKE 2-like n=1 Tax=Arachis hypogaea TaxID=3818 RepID=UPI000DEC344C|nr:protein MAIN-LIKE 2-like [Arachis hypogaea]
MGKCDITHADEHISEYLQHPIYGSRNLHTRHLHQIDSYDARVEEQLRESGFSHISQIGRIMSHGPTIDALVERWRLETHTFHLPHGECTITLEDAAMIFGLRTHGLPVTGSTNHSTSGFENECMTQFGIAPDPNDHRGSGVKLAWFRTLSGANI